MKTLNLDFPGKKFSSISKAIHSPTLEPYPPIHFLPSEQAVSCILVLYSEDLVAGPLAPFGTPVWNPFLNLRGTSFM